MNEQEMKKDPPESETREAVKRGHLTFVGSATELPAKILRASCCLYVSSHSPDKKIAR